MINYFIGVDLGTSGIKEGVPISHIQGIAIDGQMGGVIGIDHHYDLVTGLDMGLDIRSEKYNQLIQRELGSLIRRKTCGSPRNAPKILMWKREREEIYNRVFRFVTLSGFVTGKRL